MDEGGTNTKEDFVVELLEEIMVEILLWLPVKSLLTFKRVCKSWCSVISSDRFIREHLKRAQAATFNRHNKFLGLVIPNWEACSTCFLFKEDSGGVICCKEFDFPTKNLVEPEEKISVWACNSCDGLICFIMHEDDAILIWNPSFPTEYKVINNRCLTGSVAMGYDPRTNDYKVIRVPLLTAIMHPLEYISIHLFSLKSNSWTTLRITKTKDFRIAMTAIYAKNHLHWLAWEYNGVQDFFEIENITSFIVYFDLVEDSLNYLNLPSSGPRNVVPMNYKDSLAIAGGFPEGEQELWVLQDYCGMKSSWIKIFKISGSRLPWNCCFSMSGELLVCKDNGLRIFDTKDGSLKDVVIEGDDITVSAEHCWYIFMSPHVESLVSPKRL